jgi:antitoxin CptB
MTTEPVLNEGPGPAGGALLWRCRRGMKELDVLLERYVRSRLPVAGREEQQALARLLELPDPVLADYLLGHATAVDPVLACLVRSIRGWASASARREVEGGPTEPLACENTRGLPEL